MMSKLTVSLLYLQAHTHTHTDQLVQTRLATLTVCFSSRWVFTIDAQCVRVCVCRFWHVL